MVDRVFCSVICSRVSVQKTDTFWACRCACCTFATWCCQRPRRRWTRRLVGRQVEIDVLSASRNSKTMRSYTSVNAQKLFEQCKSSTVSRPTQRCPICMDRVKSSFVIFNIRPPGTLTLKTERQSARMSKITRWRLNPYVIFLRCLANHVVIDQTPYIPRVF